MADEIKRLHYYNQQFLREPDFTDEQRYHMEMRRRLNKRLHGWGIVDGLQVTWKSDHVVTVAPGMAIDGDGREIVLFQPHDINLPSGVGERGRRYYITVRYNFPEELTDPPPPEDMITPADRTRVTERPDFPPPSTAVVSPDITLILARVSLANAGDAPIQLPINDANRQYIPISVDGKIGIGNPAPADSLDVNGDIRIRGGDIKDAGGTSRITLTQNGNLDLKEDGGSSRISIRNNGNVGINTTTPAETLDVNGDIRVRGADIKDAGGTTRITLTQNGNLDLKEDGGSSRISIRNNGNVGINTTTPAETLDVNGDIRVRGADIKDAGGTARITLTDNGNLDLKEDGGTSKISIRNNGNVGINTTTPNSTLDVNGDIRVRGADIRDAGGTARITLTDNGNLDLKEDGGGSRISIRNNGYVGINDTTPSYQLDVNGSLRVRGEAIIDRLSLTDHIKTGFWLEASDWNPGRNAWHTFYTKNTGLNYYDWGYVTMCEIGMYDAGTVNHFWWMTDNTSYRQSGTNNLVIQWKVHYNDGGTDWIPWCRSVFWLAYRK